MTSTRIHSIAPAKDRTCASVIGPGSVATKVAVWVAPIIAMWTFAAGCELSIDGAPCPCAAGWVCSEPTGICTPDDERHCVFWQDIRTPDGLDITMPSDVITVSGYVDGLPSGQNIVITGTGTLKVNSGNHWIFVEEGGNVLEVGPGNQVFLEKNTRFVSSYADSQDITIETGAIVELDGGSPAELTIRSSLNLIGVIQVPFAQNYRYVQETYVSGEYTNSDIRVGNGGVINAVNERANNLFIEANGRVDDLDYATNIYVKRNGYYNTRLKYQSIHYEPGALLNIRDIIENDVILYPHDNIQIGRCLSGNLPTSLR